MTLATEKGSNERKYEVPAYIHVGFDEEAIRRKVNAIQARTSLKVSLIDGKP